MALAATGPLGLPLYNLQTILANSASFQTWIGATGTAPEKVVAARARIYMGAVPGASLTRPCAVINLGDDWVAEATSGGARNHFNTTGSSFLAFEGEVSEAYEDDCGEALLEFVNAAGAAISDIETLAGSGAYLVVNRISKHGGPMRVDIREKDSLGDYFAIEFEIAWGEAG